MRVTSPSWLLPANYLYPFWWAGVDDDGECDYDDGTGARGLRMRL